MKKEKQLKDIDGVGPEAIKKLEKSGIFDLMSLAVLTPNHLSDMSGLGVAIARKAIQQARDFLDLGFQTGIKYEKKRDNIVNISTGSQNLDNLLGGKGIESRAITEAFAAFGSGKTQIALQLAVNVQLVGGKAVYIDTEGTFRPGRIRQMAEALDLDPEKTLNNIFVARGFNSDNQMLLLENVNDLVKKHPIKLVIVDSLTTHFRAEYAGRGKLADRQQKLNKHMHDLIKLAEIHNLAIFVTNQVMVDPAQMFGDPTKAVGGNIVAHASTFRLYLRRGRQGSRVAKLIDSPNLPDDECVFYVTKYGVGDTDEIKTDKLKKEAQQKL